jgi:hypothetical protein
MFDEFAVEAWRLIAEAQKVHERCLQTTFETRPIFRNSPETSEVNQTNYKHGTPKNTTKRIKEDERMSTEKRRGSECERRLLLRVLEGQKRRREMIHRSPSFHVQTKSSSPGTPPRR